jgi:uncharacterized membrane protein YdjX (TVP38/TMEM64 family)
MTRHPIVASAGLIALVLLIALGVVLLPAPDIDGIRQQVAASGVWAPATYLALMVGSTQLPFPRTVWTVSAGVIFGSVAGVALALGGMALSAAVSLVVVRWVGGPAIRRAERDARVRSVQDLLSRRGWVAVLGLRMIPVVPFTPLNYACGLSRIPLLPCLAATVIGSVPMTVAAVAAADAVVADGDPRILLLGVLIGGIGLCVAGREVVLIWRLLSGQGSTVDESR